MQQQYDNQKLSDALKSAAKLLNLEQESQLNRDLLSICTHLTNPNIRIAVFGPFNHGKSTLLNAMLGERALPIDLIPTTGAAIIVKYGEKLQTKITLVDNTEIIRDGSDILKQFAILDSNRRMRNDVAAVEVLCPHPFLKTGVEFLDLPGTNDREEQDNLVRDRLPSANLVIQLLDARKLMTLSERENLRDWLLDRGIKTVIFVANFLNLLEPEDQKQVQNRLRFVAESFRAELPSGFSNLYRVDALPALRARLKSDVGAANSSGLVAFETALQNIVEILHHRQDVLPRVQAIASQIQQLLKVKIDTAISEIQTFERKNNAEVEIKQRAQQLIKQGFTKSVTELRNWLALPQLLNKYQADATVALAEDKFKAWENVFKKDLMELQIAVVKWLYQAYEFFQAERPEDLLIPFPSVPQVIPTQPNDVDDLSDPTSIAVGSGIGWLLGGPVGAAVIGGLSYLVNKNLQQQEEKTSKESHLQQIAKTCLEVTYEYFSRFSTQGLSILAEYESKAEKVIRYTVTTSVEIANKRADLQKWQNSFNQLHSELGSGDRLWVDLEDKGDKGDKVNKEAESVGEKFKSKSQSIKSEIPSPPSSPSREDVEDIFRAWELDEEIARMKVEMNSPHSQTQSYKVEEKQGENDKIARAYAVLELQPGASIAEVKQAYRAVVKKWHPDLFINQPQLQQQAQEKLQIVNEAYTILCARL